ncbi:MAG: 3-oxoacyl-ACP reductase [Gemmatimonadetes bacterium RIFCSPLOWO2_12_FULL_68_9]|nr:MAG: 3-oxoacyl-ACP reductase [Gemmatimonadetes bacterium RIFCSPLOWO2_12_FULL_68_9]
MDQSGLFDLTGKTAAVIGGGSGIGEAVAIGAAKQGADVIVLDANEAAAQAVAARIGGSARAAALDIRDGEAVRTAIDDIARERGRLDIVICTPSINVRRPILRYAEEEFDKVVAVNLKGSFNVLQAAGRVMTAQRGGSIVIFSSIRSQVVEPGQSVYAMTKAGILQLVRGGASEFGPFGVRVNAVGPGVVETPLTAPIRANAEWYAAYANKSALGRWARADEMVGPTLFLVSDAASYVTGIILFADGGWTATDGRFTPPGM